MESHMEVYIRLWPTDFFAYSNLFIQPNSGIITISLPRRPEEGSINHQPDRWEFDFERVIQQETQETIFKGLFMNKIDNFLWGFSQSVISYGQTGSGKTFTMQGINTEAKLRGILPRAIFEVFKGIEKLIDTDTEVYINYIEVFNELIKDLISTNEEQIQLIEDPIYGVYSKGSLIKQVFDYQQALELLFKGQKNWTVSEHKLNKDSSWSHSIFTIFLKQKSKYDFSSNKFQISKFQFVDLAGSERTKKTNSSGEVLQQANFINKSLSYLEQLIISCNKNNIESLPYWQSKLTYLLKDSIKGGSQCTFIAHIWPQADHIDETLSTLRYAQRLKSILNRPQQKFILDQKERISYLEKQVWDLQIQLEMIAGQKDIEIQQGKHLSKEQLDNIKTLATNFLNNKTTDLDVHNVQELKELLNQTRILFQQSSTENKKGQQNRDQQNNKQDNNNKEEQQKEQEKIKQVGELITNGISIGQVKQDINENNQKQQEAQQEWVFKQNSDTLLEIESSQIHKQDAFLMFQKEEGKEMVFQLKEQIEIYNKLYQESQATNPHEKKEIQKENLKSLKNQMKRIKSLKIQISKEFEQYFNNLLGSSQRNQPLQESQQNNKTEAQKLTSQEEIFSKAFNQFNFS